MNETQHDWDLYFEAPKEIFDGLKIVDDDADVVAVKDGQFVHIGKKQPECISDRTQRIDCTDKIIVPGLIDCHTHLVFGGDRSEEFSLRAGGASYEALLAAGGGIHHTVQATRQATALQLDRSARKRLNNMLRFGVTTVEVKSGYGLDLENELKLLRVIRGLNDHPIDCVSTCLAAHVVPKEFQGNKAAYLKLIINDLLPTLVEEGLCEFVDIFVENNAFSVRDAEVLFEASTKHGLVPKIHAEQLSYQGSVELAAAFDAASADHLEYISPEGIQALSESTTVAVLLPTCNLFLRQDEIAPARRLIDSGCQVALSTDCNPGSSMVENLLLSMSLGMTQMGMTGLEVWRAVTHHAASAVRRPKLGRIAIGMPADIALFDCRSILEVPYRMGSVQAHAVYKNGHCVFNEGKINDL